MRELIVNSLELIAKIGVGVFTLIGFLSGWWSGGLIGAVCGVFTSFFISCVVFGLLFLLLDINENMRAIRHLLEKRENS